MFLVIALLSIGAPLVAQAPPQGSGSVIPTGPIRVIDGDTLDVIINGRRVAVGLIGLKAPEGNTPCGKEAIQAMGVLVHAGIRFDEDTRFTFDKKTRRMYYARSRKDGHSLIVDMVSAGYAEAESVADLIPEFAGAEDGVEKGAQRDAQNGKRGCLWGGDGQPGPKSNPRLLAAAGITRADVDRAKSETEPNGGANVTNKLAAGPAQPRVSTPAGFTVQGVASSLTNPTAMTFLPDGRILIALKAGVVRVYKPGSGLLATPFIDITGTVNDFWDHGLIGIAADLNFATNHFVYLLYTYENDPTSYSGPKTSRLSRVTASGDTASPSTMTTILGTVVGPGCGGFPAGSDCLPSENSSHSIGNVKSAPDGTLYVTVGDGASFNVVDPLALRSQDVDSLAGKMLHITTSGLGVATNPFWNGTASANRSKVWSYGHRNSFRFNQRPTTGTIYVGEVGWDTWEKLQLSVKGANQGWPCYEGGLQQPGYAPFAQCQALYTANTVNPPLFTWSHTDSQGQTISAAAVGGAFYTGTAFPAQYQGAYFFADYGQSLIRYLTVDANDKLVGTPTDFALNADGPVDVEMGPDGNLYYLAINTGELRTILYGAPTIPPPGRGTTYLSDLTWISVANGWGPVEKDMSNGEEAAGDGGPITVGGVAHTKGLGAHAPSDIHYNIGGVCSSFNAVVGIDGEILPAYQSTSSVVFQVWGDGAKLYDSGIVGFTTPPVNVSVDLTGKSDLELIVTDAGDGNAADHADWADARVTCGVTSPNPTATIAKPLSTLTYKVGDTVTYSGSATDGSGGTVPPAGWHGRSTSSLPRRALPHPSGRLHQHRRQRQLCRARPRRRFLP